MFLKTLECLEDIRRSCKPKGSRFLTLIDQSKQSHKRLQRPKGVPKFIFHYLLSKQNSLKSAFSTFINAQTVVLRIT